MPKLQEDTLLIAYDNEIGLVYFPKKGALLSTTSNHAKGLQRVYDDYLHKRLLPNECSDFEQFIEQSFQSKAVLPEMSYPSLLERDVLMRLEIMLANDCNLNCKYCYANGGSYGKARQRMQPKKAIEYLDALLIGRFHNVGTVMLFGGEPTLVPETIQTICNYFSKKVKDGTFHSMPVFTMVSNGTLIDERLVSIIKEFDIKVTISIDGPKDINDLLRVDRNGNGTFSRIERGVRMLKMADCPPRMIEATYTSLHSQMGYEKEDIRTYLKNHFGVEKVLISNCTPVSDGNDQCDNSLAFSDDSISEPFENSMMIKHALSRTSYIDISCGAGINSCTIMPNGDLFPCHFFVNHPEFRISTYSDETYSFDDYPTTLLQLSYAHKDMNPTCKACWAKSLCSACPAGMLLDIEDNSFCKQERNRLVRVLLSEAKKVRH